MGLFNFFQNIQTKIGNQIWMTKNLNVRRFRNGDIIPQAKTLTQWANALNYKKPACCYPEFKPRNGKKYGMLYNWYAVNDKRVLSPIGWSIPSYEELATLIHFLGGSDVAAVKLKRTIGWAKESNGTNESGFSALPGGVACKPVCDYNDYSTMIPFHRTGVVGSWWSASECNGNDAHSLQLDEINRGTFVLDSDKNFGLSVRCIKNNENNLPRSYRSKDLKQRLQWIRNARTAKSKQRELLLSITENDSYSQIRNEAFKKLGLADSQKALKNTTIYNDDWDIQADACKRINDQSILAEIVIKHYRVVKHIKHYIGYDLIDVITDQSLLLKIVIESFELTARSNAVKKITDLNIIRQLIDNTKSDHRASVVHLIKDQNWLKELAVNDDSVAVQTAAIEGIEDPKFLINIIKTSDESCLKIAAVKKIKDEAILSKFFFKERDENVRDEIINYINNDEILLSIVSKEQVCWIKCKAAEKITGIKEIKIILERESQEVIAVVVKNITNAKILLEILQNNLSSEVRKEVVRNKNLKDQDVLKKVALEDKDPQIRLATIERLESLSVINNMAINDKDMTVQLVAIDRVMDEKILLEIHDNYKNHISVKNRAFSRCMELGFYGNFT